MIKKVVCEKCGKAFYVERVKRFISKIHCNTCFESEVKRLKDTKQGLEYLRVFNILKRYDKFLTEVKSFTPPSLPKSEPAAHENESKKESRQIIVKCIKEHFKRPVSFVEFLGGGNGALYYANNLPISRMLLVERNKKSFDTFYAEKYKQFCRQTWPMAVDLLRVNLEDHLKVANPFWWDVVNLDFCTYCYGYKNGVSQSPLTLIQEFFTGAVIRGAIIITSFMIDGYGIRIASETGKTIYRTEEEITAVINGLAARRGFKLEKVLSNKYKSNSKTTMINLGFRIG